MSLTLLEDVTPAKWLGSVDVLAGRVDRLFPKPFDRYTEIQHPELEGSAPVDVLSRIADLLPGDAQHDEVVYFAVWEGWGDVRYRDDNAAAASLSRIRRRMPMWVGRAEQSIEPAPLQIPKRGYYLLRGSIDDATASHGKHSFQGSSMWWPQDRSWFVTTEVDALATYVGTSHDIQRTLLSIPSSSAVAGDDPWLVAGV